MSRRFFFGLGVELSGTLQVQALAAILGPNRSWLRMIVGVGRISRR